MSVNKPTCRPNKKSGNRVNMQNKAIDKCLS